MLNDSRQPTAPAERHVARFSRWFSLFNPMGPGEQALRQIGPALAALLDSNVYRDVTWSNNQFTFVTDSEHRIVITAVASRLKAGKRKAQFWVNAKASNVPYKDWCIFGDALRELDLSFISFEHTKQGFDAELLLTLSPTQNALIRIRATPTDMYKYTLHCGRAEVATTHLLRG